VVPKSSRLCDNIYYHSTAQRKSPSRREDLSLVTYSKLYTTVVKYCPLYTQGLASSQGIERIERYKRAKRRAEKDRK